MLVEIYSSVFMENNEIRKPIKLKEGLNVIQGATKGSNSIGKSSALLAIDFVFGGDTYLNSDGVKNIGNHTIYSCFKFDKKYYFGRSTLDPDTIILCNPDYSETENTKTKKEFLDFLMEKYISNKTDLSFRQLVSTYFRIAGKNNNEANYPLQGYRNQSTKESIKILMSLLDYFKDIEPFHARYDLETDKLKTFKNARKYSFISNLVGGKTKFEENIKTINELKAELESLTDTTSEGITQEEIEQSKHCENLKSQKLYFETQLERYQRRNKLLSISMEYGLMPTEADIQSLTEFFPEANVKKIFEIENYHKKLSSILSSEFGKEKEILEQTITELKTNIENISSELSNHKVKNQFSKEFLDKHSSLQRQIQALEEQNEAFKEEKSLSDLKSDAKNKLETNVASLLADITFKLNQQMYEFNETLYVEKRNSPKISLKNYNSYEFFTPQDTGTGTNFKGLILFDLAMLYLSSLPALAHDSLLFKNIDDEGVDGIMRIYDKVHQINKQVFIAFDKQSSYSDETYEILQNNRVLQLASNGHELYGKSWNREAKNETKL